MIDVLEIEQLLEMELVRKKMVDPFGFSAQETTQKGYDEVREYAEMLGQSGILIKIDRNFRREDYPVFARALYINIYSGTLSYKSRGDIAFVFDGYDAFTWTVERVFGFMLYSGNINLSEVSKVYRSIGTKNIYKTSGQYKEADASPLTTFYGSELSQDANNAISTFFGVQIRPS